MELRTEKPEITAEEKKESCQMRIPWQKQGKAVKRTPDFDSCLETRNAKNTTTEVHLVSRGGA